MKYSVKTNKGMLGRSAPTHPQADRGRQAEAGAHDPHRGGVTIRVATCSPRRRSRTAMSSRRWRRRSGGEDRGRRGLATDHPQVTRLRAVRIRGRDRLCDEIGDRPQGRQPPAAAPSRQRQGGGSGGEGR